MELTNGHALTYVLSHEALFPTDEHEIHVASVAANGHTDWELTFRESVLAGENALSLMLWDEAFNVFAQFPELFAALAKMKFPALDDVRDLLDSLGAEDNTCRPEDAAKA